MTVKTEGAASGSPETLPGPFEWDVKRLAASLAVAGRDNGFGAKARRKIVLAAVEAYRTAMRGFAGQPFLDVWYAHLDIEQAIGQFRSQMKKKRFKEAEKLLAKAHTKDSTKALSKLTTEVEGRRRIISDPPTIVPLEELFTDVRADAIYAEIRTVLGKYRRTLQSDRRHLLRVYAGLCGWTLARAHARSGDRVALAAYVGGSGAFDQAVADFAETYADQNERDYAELQAAVKDGRAEAATEI